MFKEVFEFFGIFGDLFKFIFKLILFFLLISSPVWIGLCLSAIFDIEMHLAMLIVGGIFILLGGYGIYKIGKNPNLTRSQKWALMNGRDLSSAEVPIKSAYDNHKERFDEAERNLKWKQNKAASKSADYELAKDGTKYVRIK